jgi:hypothetical protein
MKLRAAFRYAGIEHVLRDPPKDRKHPREDRQVALDTLLDLVDDALASKVVPPGSLDKSPNPKAVLDKLQQAFGTSCATMHSMLRSSIQALKQNPGESVSAYMLRSEDLFDRLRTAGGSMSSKTFLQALKEGVLPQFRLTVKLFERDAKQTVALLSGALQAEENSLARQETLRGPASNSAVGNVTLALQHIDMPDDLRRSLNTVLAVTNGGGSQKWTPKPSAPGANKQNHAARHEQMKMKDPARYAALEAASTCFNCGVTGHRAFNCKAPQVKPYRFSSSQPRPAGGAPATSLVA